MMQPSPPSSVRTFPSPQEGPSCQLTVNPQAHFQPQGNNACIFLKPIFGGLSLRLISVIAIIKGMNIFMTHSRYYQGTLQSRYTIWHSCQQDRRITFLCVLSRSGCRYFSIISNYLIYIFWWLKQTIFLSLCSLVLLHSEWVSSLYPSFPLTEILLLSIFIGMSSFYNSLTHYMLQVFFPLWNLPFYFIIFYPAKVHFHMIKCVPLFIFSLAIFFYSFV